VTVARPLKFRASARPLPGPLVHLDTVTSTNDHARALASTGAPGGTVVVAEVQTAGRGRQGRTWVAPRGSGLALSLLHRPGESGSTRSAAYLPFAAAVAVSEACEGVSAVKCQIKWPNDVLVGGRKIAGILIESRPADGWAVIGIGLNVDTREEHLGPDLSSSATSLRIETGGRVDRNLVLDALLDALAARLGCEQGLEDVLAAYRQRDALEGKRVKWTSGGELRRGEAQGVDDDGNLVVLADGGERLALDAGEVHLLGA